MKKHRAFSILVLLLLVSVSCKRDYSYGCYYTQSQPYDNYTYTIHDTKSQAEKLCYPHLQEDPTPDECVLNH